MQPFRKLTKHLIRLGKSINTFGLAYIAAIHPIIALFLQNQDKVDIEVIIRPTLCAVITTTLLLALLTRFFRSKKKATIAATGIWAIFFFYGVFSERTPGILLGTYYVQAETIVFLAISGLSVLITASVKKTTLTLEKLYSFLSATTLALICMLVITGVNNSRARQATLETNFKQNIELTANGKTPDIYYILLDGHGRQDVLKEIYSYDSSTFVKGLKELGFYVTTNSRTNYIQTYLAMSAALNMDYLDPLFHATNKNKNVLIDLISNNEVFRLLEKVGYDSYTLSTGWEALDKENSAFTKRTKLNAFEITLLDNSLLGYFTSRKFSYINHKESVEGIFDNLPRLAQNKNPTIAYAHILSPHPPFVFDSDGNYVQQKYRYNLVDHDWFTQPGRTREDYIKLYRNQVTFIDQQVLNLVSEIINDSNNSAVIIIQSDHGPASSYTDDNLSEEFINERTAIFNAYYFPDKDYETLYDDISPVNSFRVILNKYFDAQLELLADKHFTSSYGAPFNFVEVYKKY